MSSDVACPPSDIDAPPPPPSPSSSSSSSTVSHHVNNNNNNGHIHSPEPLQDNTSNNNVVIQKNKNILKLDIRTILELNELATNNKIKPIKELFRAELRQVNLIIAVICKCKERKIGYYLGMTFKEIVRKLKYYDKYFLFKSDAYVRHLLELMADPKIGILEKTKSTKTFNITSFGSSYYNYGKRTTKDF